MIGFLSPLFLLAGLAAAIPIILHLIRRREARRILFPAVRYLRRAEKRHARRLRIRHLLLLATRVAIVITLAALAAGPLIGRGGAADHKPTALAIVIDDSQSSAQLVGGRRLLDILAERAAQGLELVTSDDRVALFSASGSDQPLIAQGETAIREYLGQIQPAAASADLPAAIRRADSWTRSVAGGRWREAHVLTDLQRVSLGSPINGDSAGSPAGAGAGAGAGAEAGPGAGLHLVVFAPTIQPAANGALGLPLPAVSPLDAGRETRISVPLFWFGPDPPAEPAVVRLVMLGNVIAVAEGEFGGSALLRLPPQDSGWVQGHVEIDNRGLVADDRSYFSWAARPATRAAVIGEIGDFVAQALDALEDGGRLRRVEPETADAWVAAAGARLERGLAEGRSVLVLPPESPLDLPLLNRRLTRAGLPWRYEAVEASGGAARLTETEALPGLSGLLVRRWYSLVPTGLTAQDSTLIRLSSGDPWLVRGTSADGTYLLLASPLTPAASAVPVSAVMVPLLDALLGNWIRRGSVADLNLEGGGGGGGRGGGRGGGTLRLPPRADRIRLPNGTMAAVEGGSLYAPRMAGNYTVQAGGSVALAFSVNAPPDEGDLRRGTRAELRTAAPDADWTWVESDEAAAWIRRVFTARRGRLAWRPLIALLVVFAILEASLAAAGRRREDGALGGVAERRADRQHVEVP